MELSEVKYQITEWIDQARDYFSHLNDEEKYGWIGEGVGFTFLVTGIVLLIV